MRLIELWIIFQKAAILNLYTVPNIIFRSVHVSYIKTWDKNNNDWKFKKIEALMEL